MLHVLLHFPQVATYRAMNIFCSILCSLIAYWYGWLFITVLSYETDETAIVGTIFVLAMTEIFLSILGTMASMERNPYSQVTYQRKIFFVLSQVWDKEKILSPYEVSNLRPPMLYCQATETRGLLQSSYDTRPAYCQDQ